MTSSLLPRVRYWLADLGEIEGNAPQSNQNTMYASPWSCTIWATITRAQNRPHYVELLPLPDEPSFPHPAAVPGSLYNPFEDQYFNTIAELPRELLIREIELLTNAKVHDTMYAHMETSMPHQSLLDEIAMLRSKIEARTIADEELRHALKLLREERLNAARRAASTRTQREVVDPDDALKAFLS